MLKPSVNVFGKSSKKSTAVIQSTENEYMSDGGSCLGYIPKMEEGCLYDKNQCEV